MANRFSKYLRGYSFLLVLTFCTTLVGCTCTKSSPAGNRKTVVFSSGRVKLSQLCETGVEHAIFLENSSILFDSREWGSIDVIQVIGGEVSSTSKIRVPANKKLLIEATDFQDACIIEVEGILSVSKTRLPINSHIVAERNSLVSLTEMILHVEARNFIHAIDARAISLKKLFLSGKAQNFLSGDSSRWDIEQCQFSVDVVDREPFMDIGGDVLHVEANRIRYSVTKFPFKPLELYSLIFVRASQFLDFKGNVVSSSGSGRRIDRVLDLTARNVQFSNNSVSDIDARNAIALYGDWITCRENKVFDLRISGEYALMLNANTSSFLLSNVLRDIKLTQASACGLLGDSTVVIKDNYIANCTGGVDTWLVDIFAEHVNFSQNTIADNKVMGVFFVIAFVGKKPLTTTKIFEPWLTEKWFYGNRFACLNCRNALSCFKNQGYIKESNLIYDIGEHEKYSADFSNIIHTWDDLANRGNVSTTEFYLLDKRLSSLLREGKRTWYTPLFERLGIIDSCKEE